MEENKKTICRCKSAFDSLAYKTKQFREGNRLMIEKKGCIGASFFRRYNPEKKLFKMTLEPDIEISVFDLILGLIGIFTLLRIIKDISGLVRFIKYGLG